MYHWVVLTQGPQRPHTNRCFRKGNRVADRQGKSEKKSWPDPCIQKMNRARGSIFSKNADSFESFFTPNTLADLVQKITEQPTEIENRFSESLKMNVSGSFCSKNYKSITTTIFRMAVQRINRFYFLCAISGFFFLILRVFSSQP